MKSQYPLHLLKNPVLFNCTQTSCQYVFGFFWMATGDARFYDRWNRFNKELSSIIFRPMRWHGPIPAARLLDQENCPDLDLSLIKSGSNSVRAHPPGQKEEQQTSRENDRCIKRLLAKQDTRERPHYISTEKKASANLLVLCDNTHVVSDRITTPTHKFDHQHNRQ